MLVLTREVGEDVVIGEDVVVRVLEVRGRKVRLGFDAPLDIAINRREVFEAIMRQTGAAALSVELRAAPQN